MDRTQLFLSDNRVFEIRLPKIIIFSLISLVIYHNLIRRIGRVEWFITCQKTQQPIKFEYSMDEWRMVRSGNFCFFNIFIHQRAVYRETVFVSAWLIAGSVLVVTFIHNLNILGSPSFRIHQNRLTIGCFIIQHPNKVSKRRCWNDKPTKQDCCNEIGIIIWICENYAEIFHSVCVQVHHP